MPPILAPLAKPAAPVTAAKPAPAPEAASPSAEAAIPPKPIATPAEPKPAAKPAVAAAARSRPMVHHARKLAALVNRLSRHAPLAHHRVVARAPGPSLPPGMVVPPPGYYGPGPYRHLVYAGPPPGYVGRWGGYRGPYPDYP
ncbi:MAG TPA: hypothetical protein VM782_08100 [Stellaceae bacterium]|nr:hypothetical protein [Stellaceae bacterium]